MRLVASTRQVAVLVVAVLLPWAGPAAEGPDLDKEVSFGVKMAQRGLWSEALFRFRRAAEQRPDDGKILNNLAVAYEAIGQYDNALLAYKEALKADSTNRELKRNYSRFVEFYQAFKPAGEDSADENAESAEEDPNNPVQEAGSPSPPPSSGSGQ